MTQLRGVVVSAVLAALLGAPPTVSAMVNLLTDPVTGTTATVFHLTVADDGPFADAEPDANDRADGATEDPAPTDALWLTAVSAALLVAAAGTCLAVWARRRLREAAEAEALALADETEAILDRRALRRARVVMPEDPIVASLGIEEPDPAARPVRRRSRRHGGGSERP